MSDERSEANIQRLCLEEDMTIYNAQTTKDKLLAALENCQELDRKKQLRTLGEGSD